MVSLGIDELLAHHRGLISHKRIGVITHYSMTDCHLVPVIDRLRFDADIHLIRLFGPEHGVLNAAPEGEHIAFAEDTHSQLPAVSLYGDVKAPNTAMLADLDALVIDLQDIGTRYYTNPSTLYYALQAARNAEITAIVLDRPNPLGGIKREGHLLDADYESFVGMLPLPIRHGLTFGEEARLIQDQFFPDVHLNVVPMAGWTRSMLWPDTEMPFVSPSPNTTHFDMTLLYPGTCLFEGTNVSLGRGTAHPFEWIGAPWVDGHLLADWFNARSVPGIVARPIYFTPFRSLYQGELVKGVQLHVVDVRQVHSLKTGATLLEAFQTLYPDNFQIGSPDDDKRLFFDLLAGGTRLRDAIQSRNLKAYFSEESAILAQFEATIQPYLLYA